MILLSFILICTCRKLLQYYIAYEIHFTIIKVKISLKSLSLFLAKLFFLHFTFDPLKVLAQILLTIYKLINKFIFSSVFYIFVYSYLYSHTFYMLILQGLFVIKFPLLH